MVRLGSRFVVLAGLGICGLGVAAKVAELRLGPQADGTFIVSTGQRIPPGTISFVGRPIDLAIRPGGKTVAVLNHTDVFLCDASGIVTGSQAKLGSGAGFRGIAWSPDGSKVYASTDKGTIQPFDDADDKLTPEPAIQLRKEPKGKNPVPGGLCITKDGKRLYVACADLNAVAEVDLDENKLVRTLPVESIPFDVRLSGDETKLVVSNWGGREPTATDEKSDSEETPLATDDRGVVMNGSATILDLSSGKATNIQVGIHPDAVAVDGDTAYICNTMSDSISELSLSKGVKVRDIPIRWGKARLLGSLPNAIAVTADRLYVCDGGDNAVCEIDRSSGKVLGFRQVGFFPTAIALDGAQAFVLNNKGNGSVKNTLLGKPGNSHDFQGTVSVIDLASDLGSETRRVAENDHWNDPASLYKPDLKVYKGAIKHVLYIIKENRTYDQIYGDMDEGNGDAKLAVLGAKVMPNHQKLAREFTLFDNAYVSGTNSAEGHNWCVQGLCNEYVERFYVGYSRTYPDEGNDAMALNPTGALWDMAAKHGKSVRIFGEFCDSGKAQFSPRAPKDWFEAWDDRKSGEHKFKAIATTDVRGMRPYMNPNVLFWPLLQNDQWRADEFIKEYSAESKANRVPNLMIMSLPCDHSEGTDPTYPTPRAMMADNDLALGRIVEAVSHSPQWRDTAIFVTEDDAQAGLDHVDGHRTSWQVISPYTKRHFVDSSLYVGPNMVRSIEEILGLPPMTRFDALALPMTQCFTDTADLTPYEATPNLVALDERNPSKAQMNAADRHWYAVTKSLDWSSMDRADPDKLNRIIWYSLHRSTNEPYPAQ